MVAPFDKDRDPPITRKGIGLRRGLIDLDQDCSDRHEMALLVTL
jgi:hypothetical protein